ncbi:MAG: Uma2 family endonuclease [Deltaproteobacteria bacterium]|nr:Uma2 family endonuclease [Deltaproteobacteria bacterium]
MVGQALKKDKRYTYQDYVSWDDGERWEIIDGEVYCMTPAPKIRHQNIVLQLAGKLGDRVKEKGCRFFIAPTDVVFDEYNVVQPDVFVVCDKNKITEDNIKGAPDLIVEVISASTELKDKREKKNLYERFGVKEYLIVYPEREYLERYSLENNRYGAPELFNWDEVLKVRSFEIEINLWEIFEKERQIAVGEGKG